MLLLVKLRSCVARQMLLLVGEGCLQAAVRSWLGRRKGSWGRPPRPAPRTLLVARGEQDDPRLVAHGALGDALRLAPGPGRPVQHQLGVQHLRGAGRASVGSDALPRGGALRPRSGQIGGRRHSRAP